MDTPISYLTSVVRTRLKNTSIPGVKPSDIYVLPEGKVPATCGERSLVISMAGITTKYGTSDYRGKIISFRVYLIRRVRAIPPDRRGVMYTDPNEAHEIHQVIDSTIESYNLFVDLLKLIDQTQTKDTMQTRYSASGTFNHRFTLYDPIHLYPGYFESKASDHDATLAGLKTYSLFTSPTFWRTTNPLICET